MYWLRLFLLLRLLLWIKIENPANTNPATQRKVGRNTLSVWTRYQYLKKQRNKPKDQTVISIYLFYHPARTEKSEARHRRKVRWLSVSDLILSWTRRRKWLRLMQLLSSQLPWSLLRPKAHLLLSLQSLLTQQHAILSDWNMFFSTCCSGVPRDTDWPQDWVLLGRILLSYFTPSSDQPGGLWA